MDGASYGVHQLQEAIKNINAPQPTRIMLTEAEQRYLEQLNLEILYAQKAYFGFLAFLRRVYDAPEGEWAMNNINVGFERIEVK